MVVYLIVLLLVGIGVVGARHGLVGGRVRGRDVPVVDPYVTAMLADGPKRVALTVLCEMVDARQLTVDKRGQARPPADAVTDPLRQAVLRGFEGQPQLRAQTLWARAARAPEMRLALPESLLFEPARRRRIALVPVPLAAAAVAGGPVILADLPAALVVMPGVVVVLVSSIALMITTPRATALGRAVVRSVAKTHRRRERPYIAAGFGVAARGGPAIRDPDLYRALFGDPS
jgi:uncharacterized protein (TIGR04222 family)